MPVARSASVPSCSVGSAVPPEWGRRDHRRRGGALRAERRCGTLYAVVLGALTETTVTFVGLEVTPASVRLLGSDGEVTATRDGADLRVDLPAAPAGSAAHVFALDL
jgi:hypothetical protein